LPRFYELYELSASTSIAQRTTNTSNAT
jgi:hypothetical protein